METRTLRQLSVMLPGAEPDELDLADELPRDGANLIEVLIRGEAWARAQLGGVAVSRSWFVDADLTSSQFDRVTLDRCLLKGCTLAGSQWTGVTFKNVVLENCRLDYATFTGLRATGPVALIGCSVVQTEFTRCKLNVLVFDECRLTSTRFEACDMRGADLRGNDLSTVGEIMSLRGAIVADVQLPALTEALVNDLSLIVR
ncbi:pentapeptide repeat-containing protein [Catellatospora aurea]|uniref:Pentapeptide repeat-containing protein n=1 Tax=Catellatospora aurea TaxID=1337874 RepID=A0ABW2GSG5_9ACTN